jgi:hypothetical protein
MVDLRSNTPCRNEQCGRCRAELLAGPVNGLRVRADARPITARAAAAYRLAGVPIYELAHGELRWIEIELSGPRMLFVEHRCWKPPPQNLLAPMPAPKPLPPMFEGEYPF